VTAAALVLLAVFDHSGIGPTRTLNPYALPALVAAVALVAVAALWPERHRVAAPAGLTAAAASVVASVTAYGAGLSQEFRRR
jgi:hypothetical protein